MNITFEDEKVFFKYSLTHPEYLNKIDLLFYRDFTHRRLHKLVKSHFNKYNSVPSKEELFIIINDNAKLKTIITKSMLDAVYDIDIARYGSQYILDKLQFWITTETVRMKSIDMMEALQMNGDSISGINNAIAQFVADTKIAFVNDLGRTMDNPDDHYAPVVSRIPSEWDAYNSHSGSAISRGYKIGSLIVYLGASNVGKSIFLANALHYNRERFKNGVMISYEMDEGDIQARLSANEFDVTLAEYEENRNNSDWVSKKLQQSMRSPMGKGSAHIKYMPSAQNKVNDIEAYCLEVEKSTGVKLDVVIVDYLKLLRPNKSIKNGNSDTELNQITLELRDMANRNGWVVISAQQVQRSAYGKLEAGSSDIAGAISIIDNSDVVYNILQDDLLKGKNEYQLKITKNRSGGGVGHIMRINIDYDKMRLTEINEL